MKPRSLLLFDACSAPLVLFRWFDAETKPFLSRKDRQEKRNTVIEKLLTISKSAIYYRFVWYVSFVHYIVQLHSFSREITRKTSCSRVLGVRNPSTTEIFGTTLVAFFSVLSVFPALLHFFDQKHGPRLASISTQRKVN